MCWREVIKKAMKEAKWLSLSSSVKPTLTSLISPSGESDKKIEIDAKEGQKKSLFRILYMT